MKPGIPDRLAPSRLDDATIADRVAERLERAGLSLVSVKAVSDDDGWQTVTLALMAPNLAVANDALPVLMPALGPHIKGLNRDNGAQVVSHWVHPTDMSGAPLLHCLWDVRMGSERWWMADGLPQEWFPQSPTPSGSDTPAAPAP